MIQLPPEIAYVIAFQQQEMPLYYWKCYRENHDNITGFEEGYFILTNQRIIYLERTGIIDVSYRLKVAINLEQVQFVSVEGSLMFGGKLNIENYKFHIIKKFVLGIPDLMSEYELQSIKQLITDVRNRKLEENVPTVQPQTIEYRQPPQEVIQQPQTPQTVVQKPQQISQPPSQQQPQNQPIINIQIGKIGDDSTTVKDSVLVKSKIGKEDSKSLKVCPYCGEKLNLPKTPKFCPYCEEELAS